METMNHSRIEIPPAKMVTIQSTMAYDVITLIGQRGGKSILDIVPLNRVGTQIMHLGELHTSPLDNINERSFRVQIDANTVCIAIGYGELSKLS